MENKYQSRKFLLTVGVILLLIVAPLWIKDRGILEVTFLFISIIFGAYAGANVLSGYQAIKSGLASAQPPVQPSPVLVPDKPAEQPKIEPCQVVEKVDVKPAVKAPVKKK